MAPLTKAIIIFIFVFTFTKMYFDMRKLALGGVV